MQATIHAVGESWCAQWVRTSYCALQIVTSQPFKPKNKKATTKIPIPILLARSFAIIDLCSRGLTPQFTSTFVVSAANEKCVCVELHCYASRTIRLTLTNYLLFFLRYRWASRFPCTAAFRIHLMASASSCGITSRQPLAYALPRKY